MVKTAARAILVASLVLAGAVTAKASDPVPAHPPAAKTSHEKPKEPTSAPAAAPTTRPGGPVRVEEAVGRVRKLIVDHEKIVPPAASEPAVTGETKAAAHASPRKARRPRVVLVWRANVVWPGDLIAPTPQVG